MAESAHINNESESDSDSVSVNSAEPEDVDDLEQLANDIFGESEDENYEFHGFYDDDTVRQIFGDSDDEAEPFEGLDVRFTMPDKFEDGWKMELPIAFDRYVSDDYIPPNCGPTINKPGDNFTYLAIFSCSSQMISSRRFAGLQQVMPRTRVNKTFKHPQLKSWRPTLASTL